MKNWSSHLPCAVLAPGAMWNAIGTMQTWQKQTKKFKANEWSYRLTIEHDKNIDFIVLTGHKVASKGFER